MSDFACPVSALEAERKRKAELVEYEKYLLERRKELEREEKERERQQLEAFAKLKQEEDEKVGLCCQPPACRTCLLSLPRSELEA